MSIIQLRRPSASPVGDGLLPSSDVLSDYRFLAGGGPRLHDYSLYRIHGLISNADWVTGRRGYALKFPGTGGFVNVDGIVNLIDPAKGSGLVWFKVDNAGVWTDGQHRILIQIRSDGSRNENIVIWKDQSSKIIWQYRTTANAAAIELDCASFTDTNWHLAIITWDIAADELKAYWDGVFLESKSGLEIHQYPLEKGRIGSRYLDDLNWYGLIDRVMWFDRILMPDEISELYEEGK